MTMMVMVMIMMMAVYRTRLDQQENKLESFLEINLKIEFECLYFGYQFFELIYIDMTGTT
jgi:hypothetical protein